MTKAHNLCVRGVSRALGELSGISCQCVSNAHETRQYWRGHWAAPGATIGNARPNRLASELHSLHAMSHIDEAILEELVYARVLLALQRMQMDDQDRQLRQRLRDVMSDSGADDRVVQGALARAWARARAILDGGIFDEELLLDQVAA